MEAQQNSDLLLFFPSDSFLERLERGMSNSSLVPPKGLPQWRWDPGGCGSLNGRKVHCVYHPHWLALDKSL